MRAQRRLKETAAKLRVWMSNYIPVFYIDVITYPYLPPKPKGHHDANFVFMKIYGVVSDKFVIVATLDFRELFMMTSSNGNIFRVTGP